MEGGADGAGAGVEFLDHSFYLLTQAGFVEVDSKDVLAGVEFLQAAPVLVGLSNLQRRHDCLEFFQQRVGEGVKGFPASSIPLR